MRIGLSLKLSEPKYNVLAQNIRALFADGSQGWWYDDNDTTTLFQDSAGTTPVTAVEQFVGLQLDKSRGLVLGPELINNAAWTVPAGWSVNSTTGVATGTNVTGFIRNNLAGSTILVVGRWYQATIRLVSYTSGTVGYPYDGTGFVAIPTTPGTYTYRFLCDNSDYTYVFGTAFTGVVDSISVRELPGNHRYAPASGNRPIWSKRVNLLTKTEQFNDNAVWESTITGTGVAATVTADQGTAPDGTNTADRIQFNLGGGTTTSDITRRRQLCVTPATAHTFSLYLRSFDGVSTYNMHITGADGATINIVVTGAWQRFTVTANSPGGSIGYAVGLRGGQTPANSNTADILAWAADLRPANQATGLLPLYQRVNTSSDYDTNGFPGYLKADGVDDFLQTNSIDFTATDKITLCAGVRKLSDAAVGTFVELSSASGINTGTFAIFAAATAAATNNYQFRSRGTLDSNTIILGYAAPITNVLTEIGEISTDTLIVRINGTQVVSSTTDQGTGNYGNYPAYFFRRAGTSNPFNGYEYGNIAVGKLLTADQLTALETYMNGLTKAY